MSSIAPEIQRAIVREYQPGVRGFGYKAIAKRYGCSVPGVRWIVKRANANNGNPVAPRGHKRRKLNNGDVRKIDRLLTRDPAMTNVEIANKLGDKIAPRTVSHYTLRFDPPFGVKKFTDREPGELTEQWKEEGRKFTQHVQKIRKHKRVYQDETGVYSNMAPKRGRGRAGQELTRPKKRHGVKRTLHVFMDQNRVRYWELRDNNANDAECKIVFKKAAKQLNEGEVLLVDRLGATRRTKKPKAQH
jgi:hypothetical protein